MPTGTTYKPTRVSDFEASKLNFNAQGVSTTALAGQSSNLDLTLTDDCLITGVWMIISGATVGDYICFQVVDTAGILSPPGTVLNQFVTNWFVPVNTDSQFDIAYPAKAYAGLTLRIVYQSTGGSDVFVAINYKLHKVLI